MSANILIVEDEPAIAVDIAINLEFHGYNIINVLHSHEEVYDNLKSGNVDLVLLDINLQGDITGIDLAETIDRDFGIPFIFLTSYSDADTVEKASVTYPAGYIVKPFKEADLAPAVKIALARKHGNKITRIPSLQRINRELLTKITSSEYTIVEKLWEGKTNIQIAEEIFLSRNTIKTHMRNVYSKLNVHSRLELMKFLRELK